jgi:hypothetical protein
MISPDTAPPFPRHRKYYMILKIAVLIGAVIFALAYLVRYA